MPTGADAQNADGKQTGEFVWIGCWWSVGAVSGAAYLKIELKVLLEALWEPGKGAWQQARRWLGWLGFVPRPQVRADLGGPQASPCV